MRRPYEGMMDEKESGSGGGGDARERSGTRRLVTGGTSPAVDANVARLVERLQEIRPTLLVLAGPIMGARIPIGQRSSVLGRSGECDITVPDDAVSARHAELRVLDDGSFHLVDLGSSNGTMVNGEMVRECTLRGGDRIVVGHTPMRFTIYSAGEDDLLTDLERRALQDALTGLPNRRYFDMRLVQEVRFAIRRGTSVSLLLVDLDHFRSINEAHGQEIGDRLLIEIAAYVSGCARIEDVVTRFGGDVLGIILRDIGAPGAATLAERLRSGIEQFPFMVEGNRVPVTVTIGVAAVAGRDGLVADAIVEAADRELARAKAGGRNRVCDATL